MLIDDVVDTSLIPEYYNPVISDPIKALVSYNHADAIIRNPSKYFTLWIQLGISYPGDYLQAFIDQTKGYWFPAPAALRTNEGISPNEIGLSWPHLLRGQFPVKISEILLKLPDMLPVYGILWSIGAYFWAVLYFAAYQFLYGQRRFLVLFVPFIRNCTYPASGNSCRLRSALRLSAHPCRAVFHCAAVLPSSNLPSAKMRWETL